MEVLIRILSATPVWLIMLSLIVVIILQIILIAVLFRIFHRLAKNKETTTEEIQDNIYRSMPISTDSDTEVETSESKEVVNKNEEASEEVEFKDEANHEESEPIEEKIIEKTEEVKNEPKIYSNYEGDNEELKNSLEHEVNKINVPSVTEKSKTYAKYWNILNS